jgi:hypothetical protein
MINNLIPYKLTVTFSDLGFSHSHKFLLVDYIKSPSSKKAA